MTTVWLSLFALSSLAFLACSLWLLVLAWRESTTWGLISTFVPFGVVGFVVKYWEDSKTQTILCVSALLISTITGLGYSVSKVNSNIGGNTGGADLWTDSSGFEAMDNTNEEGNDSMVGNPTTPEENVERPQHESTAQNEIPIQDTEADSQRAENPALDEPANSEAAASEDPPPGLGHRGHKVVPLENLPSLRENARL